MSDLRTRIACVLAGITPNNTPKPEYVELADAVIRELKLERRSGWTENGHKKAHRYVTEWETDE